VLERLEREVGVAGVVGRLAKLETRVKPSRIGLGRLEVSGLGALPFLSFLSAIAIGMNLTMPTKWR